MMVVEESTQSLFPSDLYLQPGDQPPVVSENLSDAMELREVGRVELGEDAVDLVRKRPLEADELVRGPARLLEQRPVGPQAREPQVREPRLPHAEQLALAAQLEVDL